ncbi:MAG: hypothetical protein ABH826_03345 [Patescibacteria group bacterium]
MCQIEKIGLLIVFLTIASLNVSSLETDDGTSVLTIKEGISKLDKEYINEDSLRFIVGLKNGDDAAAFFLFQRIFWDNNEKNNIKSGRYFAFDTSITEEDLKGKNILILGGPCANRLWEKYSDETCENWPLEPKQAIVKLIEKDDGRVIFLAAGTTARDTYELTQKLLNYENEDDFNQKKEVILNFDYNDIAEWENLCDHNTRAFGCQTFSVGFTYPFRIGKDYVDVGVAKADTKTGTINLKVGNELYVNQSLGAKFYLSDNKSILFDRFIIDPVTGSRIVFYFIEPLKDKYFEISPGGYTLETGDINIGMSGTFTSGELKIFSKDLVNVEVKAREITTDSAILEVDGERASYKVGDTVNLKNGRSFRIYQISPDNSVFWYNRLS